MKNKKKDFKKSPLKPFREEDDQIKRKGKPKPPKQKYRHRKYWLEDDDYDELVINYREEE